MESVQLDLVQNTIKTAPPRPLVKAMGHIALQVTDLDSAIYDATKILGLRLNKHEADSAYLAASSLHHEIVYHQGEENGLHGLGLVAASTDALQEIRKRVEDENLAVTPMLPYPGIEDGFSFIGPEGYVFDVYIGEEHVPLATPSFSPTRYGHFNIHPKNATSMKEFLVKVFGMLVSDNIGEVGYFLRCNADHHGVAILTGRSTFHHHAWQAQSVGELTQLGDRLHAIGRDLLWGPVRHGAGNNIAAYYEESSGAVVELYTDMEQIYDDARPPIDWDPNTSWYNLWNDYRPETFRSFGISQVRR